MKHADADVEVSAAARALSRLGAAKGGRARAIALGSSERTSQAKRAAEARWGTNLPKATHEGELPIGDDIVLPCAVLSDGRRVLSQRGVGRALGRHYGGKFWATDEGAGQVPFFIGGETLKRFITDDLRALISQPLVYRGDGGITHGVEASVLPRICQVWLKAREAGALKLEAQRRIARAAETLIAGFATVGIIALVDEATGYQADRARDELNKILKEYISDELMPWVKVFPDEFFRHVYRLQGWEYRPGVTQGPRYVGKLINDYVYKRLPPGVLDELQKRNPKINGRRKRHHHRLLTDHTGVPHLDKQIVAVTTLMKVSTDKTMFEELLVRAFPKRGEQITLGLSAAERSNDRDK